MAGSPYKSGKIQGTLLSALRAARPGEINFDPKLTGWYAVYVCIPINANLEVQMKPSRDEAFYRMIPLRSSFAVGSGEESLWRGFGLYPWTKPP